MPTITKEEEYKMKDKLEYIGLDLNSIPDFIKQNKVLKFRPSKTFGEESYRVYKYIDVREIQILLTPKNRLDSLEEKYNLSSSLYSYIEPKTEEDILKHTKFLEMLKEMKIEKIQEIEEEQKKLNKNIPFRVKYEHNYLWQIFFDEFTNQYFMLVTTEDKDYEAFFYLLKQQIKSFKSNKANKIFVPICYQYYKNEFLKRSEISDMQKYIWLFTKDWPNIYEVYNKENNMCLQIVGNTYVYEKIKSPYKIKLEDKEETIKFFKLIKALFIMQTELPHYYNFETKISPIGGLEFFLNGRIIEYDNLSRIIEEEAIKYQKNITDTQKEIKNLKEKLEMLNINYKNKQEEYIAKEKQIALYLECRKTFFGRIKYYFKSKKMTKTKQEDTQEKEIKKENEIIEVFNFEKEFYTIEDLVNICKKAGELETNLKNTNLDIKAIENKLKRFTKKNENADLYLKEINSHKKSIFDFWKFTNKDEDPKLTEAQELEEINNSNLAKSFDYENDFEELGQQWDKMQRDKFTKEECDSIYLTSTKIMDYLQNEEIDEKKLDKIKNEAQLERKLFTQEEYDIFGMISEDKTKIKTLANKKHRESPKNIWTILDINKKTNIEQWKEKIENIKKQIYSAIEKSNLPTDLNVYFISNGVLDAEKLTIGYINPNGALSDYTKEDKINLYCLHIKQGAKVIALSNIIYYDNNNKTLPVGMNVGDKVLLDLKQFKLELNRQKLFRINQMIDDMQVHTKIICVYEYNVL